MPLAAQAAPLRPDEIRELLAERQQQLQRIAALEAQNADLTRQVVWFKRQLFGRKSERRLLEPDAANSPSQVC